MLSSFLHTEPWRGTVMILVMRGLVSGKVQSWLKMAPLSYLLPRNNIPLNPFPTPATPEWSIKNPELLTRFYLAEVHIPQLRTCVSIVFVYNLVWIVTCLLACSLPLGYQWVLQKRHLILLHCPGHKTRVTLKYLNIHVTLCTEMVHQT